MEETLIIEPSTDEITVIINEYDESAIITDHSKLSNLDYDNSGHTGFASQASLTNYVLKVTGKALSTNDFNNTYKTKLDSIADGAEVNVNADWNATSGDALILNKPTIPNAQVNSDWNATSGDALILNKPTIPNAQVNSDWNSISGISEILNKPNLATVATSGSYNDLADKPDLYVKPTFNTLGSTTTNYTLVLADQNKIVEATSTSSITITIPLYSNVAFEVGTEINIMRYGSGTVQFAVESGVTLNSRNNLLTIGHQYAGVSLIKRATDEWYLVGDLA